MPEQRPPNPLSPTEWADEEHEEAVQDLALHKVDFAGAKVDTELHMLRHCARAGLAGPLGPGPQQSPGA